LKSESRIKQFRAAHLLAQMPGQVFPKYGEKTIIVQDNTNQLEWQINELPTLAKLQVWILKTVILRIFTCKEKNIIRNPSIL
jgi:hypothetical protein